MKRLVLLAFMFHSPALFAQSWSNCSQGNMTATGASGGCDRGPASPWPAQDIGWTGTRTYNDTCTNNGNTYFTKSSTVTGYGGCQYADSAGWTPCPATFSTTITNLLQPLITTACTTMPMTTTITAA
jgi:hypothetical protein